MNYRTKRVRHGQYCRLYVEWEGKWFTVKEVARICGVCYQTAYERIQKGIPINLTEAEARAYRQRKATVFNPVAASFCQLKFRGARDAIAQR